MAAGRRLICSTSAGFTPSTVRPTDSAKNAMPNDMAKRGWRTIVHIGSSTEACKRSSHELPGCATPAGVLRRWESTPVVDARMFTTRLAGGSTSVRPFSQLCPASASVSSGPHALQLCAWARNRSSTTPVSTPSTASVSRRSNSWHCISLLGGTFPVRSCFRSGITSPAYRYVVGGGLVPPAHDLFEISQCPPELSKLWQFHDSPYPVNPLESMLRAALAKACPKPCARLL